MLLVLIRLARLLWKTSESKNLVVSSEGSVGADSGALII